MIIKARSGQVIAGASNVQKLNVLDGPTATPEGYYDTPYIYARNYYLNPTVANWNLYTSGSSPNSKYVWRFGALNTISSIEGDADFVLRRICVNGVPAPINSFPGSGPNVVAGSYNTYNSFNFADRFGSWYYPPIGILPASVYPINNGPEITVVPEKIYPASGGIPFIINPNNVGASGAGAFPTSAYTTSFMPFNTTPNNPPWAAVYSIAFQGVKRHKGTADRTPNYAYTERMWTIAYTFNLTQKFLATPYASYIENPAQTFYVPVKDYDFELLSISTLNTSDTAGGTPIGYMARLYDANSVQLSNDFVHMQGVLATNAQTPYNCFPSPGLIYPANSNIRLDVKSLLSILDNGGPQTVYFRGVQRIPCSN